MQSEFTLEQEFKQIKNFKINKLIIKMSQFKQNKVEITKKVYTKKD